MAKADKWARLLAYVTGLVNQELLLQSEYLAAENRILPSHLPPRLRLSDPEREALAEIGKRLGRRVLAQVACVANPETILRWYRKLIAEKFELGIRPDRLGTEKSEPRSLRSDGWECFAPSTGSSLRPNAVRAPAGMSSSRPTWKCSQVWTCSTVEVLTWTGLATYYVPFLIHLESRRITIAGTTRHPTETWMEQMARNVTDESTGCLRDIRYVLHDRDTKFCTSFESILTAAGVKPLKLPARSPNLNAFAERWVRSAKEECLSKLILFGEGSLKRALAGYVEHFHSERPHQGKGNVLLFST